MNASHSIIEPPDIDLEALADRRWFLTEIRRAIPPVLPPIIPWAEAEVRVFGVKGERFQSDNTPWTRYPIELCDRIGQVRSVTFIKPVQTGGSVVGEIAVCRWIIKQFGKIQWNWDTDEFAHKRWYERIERILKGCRPVRDRWPRDGQDRHKAQKCLVIFANISLDVQGVFDPNSLDSDSIPLQVNEEVHKWKPGHLEKAYRRGTACAFPFALNISNASTEGDQLHEAWSSGTQQHWEVKCPGCSNPHHEANAVYHVMRTRWEDNRPGLGGLRYDTTGCKRDDGTFNYNKLAGTLRFQMPCGAQIPNDIAARRALSASGRYSAARNEGAQPGDISLTYEAVTSHDIDWIQMVKEKHSSLRALKHGDEEPWKKYLQERESQFYSAERRPYLGQVVINTAIKKNRAGLPGRATRMYAADKQRGYKSLGQLSHYWLVIEDIMENCNSQIVFEGMVQTDTELIATLDDHECPRSAGVVDASWDTKAVLEMCYRNGLNAVMGNLSGKGTFLHKDKVRRFYSEDRPIHGELNMPPKFNYSPSRDGWQPSAEEPMVIFYNKAGLLANHFFIRDNRATVLANKPEAESWEYITREIPGDVSEDFKLQNESWERVPVTKKQSQDEVEGFKKIRKDDHLLMCLAYIDLLKDWSGLLGDQLARLGIIKTTETQGTK